MHGRRRVMNKLFCFSGNVTKSDQQTIYYHLQVLIKQILYLICSDFFLSVVCGSASPCLYYYIFKVSVRNVVPTLTSNKR
jgi:hypothetical protein